MGEKREGGNVVLQFFLAFVVSCVAVTWFAVVVTYCIMYVGRATIGDISKYDWF